MERKKNTHARRQRERRTETRDESVFVKTEKRKKTTSCYLHFSRQSVNSVCPVEEPKRTKTKVILKRKSADSNTYQRWNSTKKRRPMRRRFVRRSVVSRAESYAEAERRARGWEGIIGNGGRVRKCLEHT